MVSCLVVKTIVVRKSHASKGASRFEFGAAHHINSQLRITDGCRKAHSLVCPFIWHYTSVIHPFEPLWKVTWPVPPSQGRVISNSGSFISLCHHFFKELENEYRYRFFQDLWFWIQSVKNHWKLSIPWCSPTGGWVRWYCENPRM